MEIKKPKGKGNKSLGILSILEDEDITNSSNEIDINLIDFNTKNFYGQSDNEDDILELAESIKEIGLLHNIVVKSNPNGRYTVISGEKRTKAYKLLYEEQKDPKWKLIPCKIRYDIKNEIDEEITLIKANRDVRERSETIKAKEVERLESLYEKKKLSGEKVGIVRKRIAEDLGISESMVHRYKKVNELIPELKEMLDKDEIGLSTVTDFIADKPENEQKLFYDFISSLGKKVSRDEAKVISENMQKTIDKLMLANDELLKQLELVNEEKAQFQLSIDSLNTLKDELEQKIKEIEESKDNKSDEEIEKINIELENMKIKYSEIEKEKEELKYKLENNDRANKEIINKLKTETNQLNNSDGKEEKKQQKKYSDTKESVEELKLDVEVTVHIKNAFDSIKSMAEIIKENLGKNKSLSSHNKDLLSQIKELVNNIPDK
ncbi:MAG TPA: ParB/RepB/Spo0J family partition protein [Clostridia bacterium]